MLATQINTSFEDGIIEEAKAILHQRIMNSRLTFDVLRTPTLVKDYLTLLLAEERNEKFMVLYLDTQHRPIAFETVTEGSVNRAMPYIRTIIARALLHNASALILVHNHPSGNPKPSDGDKLFTKTMVETAKYLDIDVLDHFIVGHEQMLSFLEEGLL